MVNYNIYIVVYITRVSFTSCRLVLPSFLILMRIFTLFQHRNLVINWVCEHKSTQRFFQSYFESYYYSDYFSFKGLTDRHYPNMLHAIILKRLPKEGMVLL